MLKKVDMKPYDYSGMHTQRVHDFMTKNPDLAKGGKTPRGDKSIP